MCLILVVILPQDIWCVLGTVRWKQQVLGNGPGEQAPASNLQRSHFPFVYHQAKQASPEPEQSLVRNAGLVAAMQAQKWAWKTTVTWHVHSEQQLQPY